MNTADLQLDFHRRYGDSSARLTITKGALPCTLLGRLDTPHSKSLSCGLSACVQAAARALNGGLIKLESTDNDICEIFRLNDFSEHPSPFLRGIPKLLENSGFFGAEILCDSTVPEYLDRSVPQKAAVFSAVMRLADRSPRDLRECARVCVGGAHTDSFVTAVSARRGYCIVQDKGEFKHLPLPLSGYRIICVHTDKPWRFDLAAVSEKELRSLRRMHPSVCGIDDIAPEMLRGGKFGALYCLVRENARIELACELLKACRLERFAALVNESQADIERFLNPPPEYSFITRSLSGTQGCICARIEENGVFAIAEDSLVDYVITQLQSDFEAQFGKALSFTVCDSGGE